MTVMTNVETNISGIKSTSQKLWSDKIEYFERSLKLLKEMEPTREILQAIEEHYVLLSDCQLELNDVSRNIPDQI